MTELMKEVLKWWEDHQYDVDSDNGEDGEYNVYDETPKFVEIAMGLKEDMEDGSNT